MDSAAGVSVDSEETGATPAEPPETSPSATTSAQLLHELDRLRQGLHASQATQAHYEAQLFEARATIQHFASQLSAPPMVTQVPRAMTTSTAFYNPTVTAPLPVLPGLSMPTPTAPIAQLIPTGSGRAAVYGPTVQARHDAAVFHSLGYDAGDLIRQSAEQAALQRELDRQVALRPMAPLLHPAAAGAPVRGRDQTNDFYDEDDFEIPLTPSARIPHAPVAATDKATSAAPGTRDAGGKGGQFPKVKMLPPHLHLKGWDVSTEKFREWYRSVELFMTANMVPRELWAAPIVAACHDKAHHTLRHLDVLRLNEPGSVDMVTQMLSNTFMRPQEDRIDEYKKKYDDLRRTYGMPMSEYIQEFEMCEA